MHEELGIRVRQERRERDVRRRQRRRLAPDVEVRAKDARAPHALDPDARQVAVALDAHDRVDDRRLLGDVRCSLHGRLRAARRGAASEVAGAHYWREELGAHAV